AERFYQGQLYCLPAGTPRHSQQTAPLAVELPDEAVPLWQTLARHRLLFLPTPIDRGSPTLKTNVHEANRIADLIEAFEALYAHNDQPLPAGAIGIITPYRAQIAQIRDTLYQRNIDPQRYTIDTVERYQGGARDIILISLCTNAPRQLAALSSLSTEGVDRKLNVAMTRAREHLVILGAPELLKASPVYRALLTHCASPESTTSAAE
ncbi:MAG: DNA helicase, partial [Lewinella sp.]|nr:DNA helicase [Lewinella sp.]